MKPSDAHENIQGTEKTPDLDSSSADAKPSVPANPNLLRDRLANERTFLAWLRTAIAITSLGFVVARFDIFLRELTRASGPAGQQAAEAVNTNVTIPLGVLLVLAGPIVVVLAAVRFLNTDAALISGRLDSRRLVKGIVVAITLASLVTGIGLAVHLLVLWPR